MKNLVRLAVVLCVLGLLRIVLPIGMSMAHYRSTPGFREWVQEHPAPDDVWRSKVPAGTVVAEGAPWRSKEGKPGDRRGQWAPRVTVAHGQEVLLDLELDVSIESREVEDASALGVPSEAFEALSVSVLGSQLDPDFHAVAVLSVDGLSHYADGAPETVRPQGPSVQLDVFTLSGPGELQLIVQEFARGDAKHPLLGVRAFVLEGLPIRRVLLGLPFSADDPPEEGLAYQVRTTFHPTWTLVDGQGSGGGFGQWQFAGTSRQYSAKLSGEQGQRNPWEPPGHIGLSTSAQVEDLYTWQGAVW